MLLNMHPVLDHSLAVVEAIVLLVAVGKVAVLEVVISKVANHQRCRCYSSTHSSKVVDVKVTALLVVVVKVARPQGNKSLSEGET